VSQIRAGAYGKSRFIGVCPAGDECVAKRVDINSIRNVQFVASNIPAK